MWSRFSAVDEALFDEDDVDPGGDRRSVGEMLRDVDVLTRQLLIDVDGEDAAPLLRGWPATVAAAGRVWQALPTTRSPAEQAALTDEPPGATRVSRADEPLLRIHAVTEVIAATLGSQGWPGAGPADARLGEVASTWNRAADLVGPYAGEIPVARPEVAADIHAARMRVMHGLYVAAHAVRTGLHEHGRDRVHAQRAGGRPVELGRTHSPYVVRPLGAWMARMDTCESAAGAYVSRRPRGYPTAVAGEAVARSDDPAARLQAAVAGWDIQAHRALAARPNPANLSLIARTHADLAGVSHRLIGGSCATGVLDKHLVEDKSSIDRLLGALERTGRDWTSLAGRWTDLAPVGANPSPTLVRAAAQLRAAHRELHQRAEPSEAAQARAIVHAAARAGAELAHGLAEHAENPDLTGPARALSIRAHNDTHHEGHAGVEPGDEETIWVLPTEILANRLVPLPRPVAQGLERAAGRVVESSARAAIAADLVAAEGAGASLVDLAHAEDPASQHVPQLGGRHTPTVDPREPPSVPI